MIPIIDQVMDLRDIIANVMLLTDDDEANDTDAWLAFTLTGIGLVPVVGSAVKGVGKVILKNTGESLSAALAVLRKLGKGDPVKYLRDINWQDLGKQSATEVKNIVKGLRGSLDDMSSSWHYDLLLPDAAIEGMQATVKRLDEVTPKIDQHMQQAAQEIGQRVNKALDEYQGQSPIRGVTDKPTKAKADELEPPKGNELPSGQNKLLAAEKLEIQASDYASLINSNKPWSWKDFPDGDKLTIKEKRAIKQKAIDKGLVPNVSFKSGTKYPDFASAGLIKAKLELPEGLWKKSDYIQFKWLDEKLPVGMRDGNTWHHSEIPGVMELVPFGPHNMINHQGGRWKIERPLGIQQKIEVIYAH